ncbi:phage tail assembly chaperone GT, partial [Staphylococcus succinus]|uniref:phage tail assembly chaperone GT n=1 Tax=Staphylococcus succinus TaxID=61015 RepID=UPI00301C99E2
WLGMKHTNIELVTEYDDSWEIVRTETYITRPTITFALVYECAEFLASMDGNPDDDEIHVMLDLVQRIYDNQFTKRELAEGLHATTATRELYKQIVFVGSGQYLSDEVEESTEVESQNVNGFKDHKENLKAALQRMVKEGGQSYNDALSLPFYIVFDELNSKAKDKGDRKESMLDAFR